MSFLISQIDQNLTGESIIKEIALERISLASG
jgi:hypothetical protein